MREAQEVVAHADSLREAHLYAQNEYDDSLSLAQAYETLKEIPLPFREGLGLGSSYAHACYHYGRMLRAKDNHVEAMKVFIDATHSRTRDYHILGRIYSNIAEMCHLAGEYQLSYDIYAKCADCFLQKGDSSNYFYALNSMAFELAEQGKKEETLALLDSICMNCLDKNVHIKTIETKAVACKKVQEYDSTIYYTSLAFKHGYYAPIILMNRAQAYSLLGKKDSAVYYANILLENFSDLYNQCNALYILTNDDESQNTKGIRKIAAGRADIQKLIENRKGKLTSAVQLLEQDLTRKPNLWWLYSIILTLTITGICIVIYIHRKQKRQGLLVQQIEKLRQETSSIQKKHNDLEVMYMTNRIQLENELINRCDLLRNTENLTAELKWKEFNVMCDVVDKQLYNLATKLRNLGILNETEIRLCVLVFLDMNRSEIADVLPYARNGVGKLKYRVGQKLGTNGKDLRKHLFSIVLSISNNHV